MFPISYRDLALMLQNRGVEIAHTTLFRLVQAYAPEIEKRIRPHLRPSNSSWSAARRRWPSLSVR
jgi:IS6 family transposase